MSLFPYLFIGVGGTGGKTIGMIHYNLTQALKRLGIDAFPMGWQFLHIDVPAKQDVASPKLHYNLPADTYVPLTTTQSSYVQVDYAISESLQAGGLLRHLAWESWRPFPPESVAVNLPIGAGQYRALGRVATVAGLKNIENAVSVALSRVKDAQVQGQFDLIERAMGRTPGGTLPEPCILIVGSVAGGSGSGMLLDVSDVVRSVGRAYGAEPDAVLFTPEVFQANDGTLSPGIAPNTYMALCELSNAMWTITGQHPTPGRDALFDRAGAKPPNPAQVGGPRAVYLVGRSSAEVSLGDADEVYSVVGRTYAEIALDPHLSNQLQAYGIANRAARAVGTPDKLGLATAQSSDLGNFGSLGFSRVTLGREFFERYASERILRMACLRLLDQHLTRHYPGDGKTDDQVLKEAVEQAWPGFLAASGVSELGQDDKVKDAIDPSRELEAELDLLANRILEDIRGNARQGKVAVAEARGIADSRIKKSLRLDEPESLRVRAVAAMRRRVDDFAPLASNLLREAVVNVCAEHGMPACVKLLDRLNENLLQAAHEVGVTELGHRREQAALMHEYVRVGEAGQEKSVKIGDALIDQIADHARQTMKNYVDLWTLEITEKVLRDLAGNLVGPWRLAVADAVAVLRTQVRPTQGVKPMDVWPRERGVPTHLQPSRVEFLLDDLAQFPSTFLDLVAKSAGEEVDLRAGDGLTNAVDEAIKQILGSKRMPPLAQRDARLTPATYDPIWVSSEGGGQRPPTRAKVNLRFDLAALERRTHAWLHDDTKVIGRHLAETWTDHLAASGLQLAEKNRRHDRLVSQFAAAIGVSRPLVRLDGNLVSAIHLTTPGAAPLDLIVSQLNVPNSEAELQQRLADAATLEYGALARLEFTTNPATSAAILTTFKTPYHAVEVASIMEPVRSQYAAIGQMVDFWRYRRARALTEWVPLGPDAAQALITGWLVGRFLGRCYFDPVERQHSVFIHANEESTPGWVNLPSRAVRDISITNQVAILLEMVALAFLDASTVGNLGPLRPYQELIKNGAGIGKGGRDDLIANYVLTGRGVVDPSKAYIKTDPGLASGRFEAIRAKCTRLSEQYDTHIGDALRNIAEAQGRIVPEVHPLLVKALSDIPSAAQRMLDLVEDEQ